MISTSALLHTSEAPGCLILTLGGRGNDGDDSESSEPRDNAGVDGTLRRDRVPGYVRLYVCSN